ncbi:hypothetical protein HAX54_014947 [Datura stramonium]|uniref:Uncharacterized protein n=1 Tax=Datura stramonium TaxID=4076 RepID=A0ABS8TNU5_DATST|nr:hypothetical protein [Datura stramonium]
MLSNKANFGKGEEENGGATSEVRRKFGVGFVFCGGAVGGKSGDGKEELGLAAGEGEKWGEWGRRREAAGGLVCRWKKWERERANRFRQNLWLHGGSVGVTVGWVRGEDGGVGLVVSLRQR